MPTLAEIAEAYFRAGRTYLTRKALSDLVREGQMTWKGGGILNLPDPQRYVTHAEYDGWITNQGNTPGVSGTRLITQNEAINRAGADYGDYYEYSWEHRTGGTVTEYARLIPPDGKAGYVFRVHTVKMDGYRYSHTFDGQDYAFYHRVPGASTPTRMRLELNGQLTDKGMWSNGVSSEAFYYLPDGTFILGSGTVYGPTDSNWWQTLGGWWVPTPLAYGANARATWTGTEIRLPMNRVTKAQYDAQTPSSGGGPNSPDVYNPTS